jgi:hypothetical protein
MTDPRLIHFPRLIKRLLIFGCKALAFPLFLALLAFWVRSEIVTDQFALVKQLDSATASNLTITRIVFDRGTIILYRDHLWFPPHSTTIVPGFSWRALPVRKVGPEASGFQLTVRPQQSNPPNEKIGLPTGYLFQASVPFWLLSVAASVLPSLLIIRWVQQCRAYIPGRCVKCNYDLRASTNRCPECGAAFNHHQDRYSQVS